MLVKYTRTTEHDFFKSTVIFKYYMDLFCPGFAMSSA